MDRTVRVLILFLCVIGVVRSDAGDPPRARVDSVRIMRLKPGDGFILPETGAMIVKEGEDLKVRFAPPANSRREPYKGVDLREGDLVLLVNGKRVKSVEALTKAHGAAAVGAPFTLGIQRGKEMQILTFPKADFSQMPMQRTIRRKMP